MNPVARTSLVATIAIALFVGGTPTQAAEPAVARPEAAALRINGELISPDFPYASHFVEVLGSKMHYVDEGKGEVVLFIHGNPTSSYLWRNVIPHVAKGYRTIAIDLIGMGKSDKPDIAYTYLDHRRYLDGFIAALGLKNITFVGHDWGSVLATDYAMRHENNVKGVALMEALLPPVFPARAAPPPQRIFGQFRSAEGERLIYDENYFVENMIPGAVVRTLSEAEMNVYREPYRERASRKPTLMWPRELPMGGEPAANAKIISNIGEWMKATHLPVLYFWTQGQGSTADYYVQNVHNIETVYLGVGRHYVQEDHPESIGRAVCDWRRRLDASRDAK
jgi:haloalkane dehalogenase